LFAFFFCNTPNNCGRDSYFLSFSTSLLISLLAENVGMGLQVLVQDQIEPRSISKNINEMACMSNFV
jgi:hypothetical protein